MLGQRSHLYRPTTTAYWDSLLSLHCQQQPGSFHLTYAVAVLVHIPMQADEDCYRNKTNQLMNTCIRGLVKDGRLITNLPVP